MCDRCYVPLHCHSHYSLLDGLSSPIQMATRAKEVGAPALAITDHGSIWGCMQHYRACKKMGIKPIIGIELYMCDGDPSIKTKENNKRYHLTVLCKNEEGFRTLMALVSKTNDPNWFYRKPRVDLKHLAEFASDGNLICLSGCIAGQLSDSLFTDGIKEPCKCGLKTQYTDQVRGMLAPDWEDRAAQIIAKYQQAFGKENYFIELQTEGMVAQNVVVECLRKVAKDHGIPAVATLDSHYARKEDAPDHRILLYSQLHTTAEKQQQIIDAGGDCMIFFSSDNFYIFDYDEMRQTYTEPEIEMSLEIADMIKPFGMGTKPCIPSFKKGEDADKALKAECLIGAKEKLGHFEPDKKKIYWERLKRELSVVREAELADYFLIVQDACKFVDEQKGPRGKGRGSGAGSLVNYLTGITGIDPIEYGLYFERFYNSSRNIPAHFDACEKVPFMNWYSDYFEQIHDMNIEEAKSVMRDFVRVAKDYDREKVAQEAKWIDENNPKMWLYLRHVSFLSHKSNPSDSHLVHACFGIPNKPNGEVKIHNGHVSLPDIDIDIGISFRAKIIEYLTERWGEEYVAQMITFGRLQGKAALKKVFRAQPEFVEHLMKVDASKKGKKKEEITLTPFDLCNEITKHIPDEAAISDELQQAREENPHYGILDWAIHNVEKVQEMYESYKPLFDQARRIEGTKKSQSKHAAGIVIADQKIEELVPLAYDPKSKHTIAGLEMFDAEAMGAVKFDFLGVAALDKLWRIQDLVNGIQGSTEIDEDFKEDED